MTIKYPLDVKQLTREQRRMRRALAEREGLTSLKIAVLAGSTIDPLVDLVDLFLLDRGLKPTFYKSDFGRYFEEAVVDADRLIAFAPQITIVHTSSANLTELPAVAATEAEVDQRVAREIEKFATIARALNDRTGCQVILSTIEPPLGAGLGSLDAYAVGGRAQFVDRINRELGALARSTPYMTLHDTAGVARRMGTHNFGSPSAWYSYKVVTTPAGTAELAYSYASLIGAMLGRSRKCLVLDLDNTVWGGIIGDDGPDRIVIGKETARGEAHRAFQEYCRQLQARGVLLAVASKNDETIAKQGFAHPDMVLKLSDISAFHANWEPKSESLRAIAKALNIGLDSLVFVDDNPAERLLVSAQLPMVAVPDVGDDIAEYPRILDAASYFEAAVLSAEDLNRSSLYAENAQREAHAGAYANYGEYLDSLEMKGVIGPFIGPNLDRIAQLTNKTNQFNLTSRRYTRAEIEAIAHDPVFVTLSARLIDRFGDNGLISVVIGRADGDALHIDLWLMSCRVLKRGVEDAVLDSLVAQARARGLSEIRGSYIATERNGMVAEHYRALGFQPIHERADGSEWTLDVREPAQPRNHHIAVESHE